MALRLRQRWPRVDLNETHPKVLAFSLRGQLHRDNDPAAGIGWLARHSGLDMTGVAGGHEFDAVLSAWATREGLSRGWADLVTEEAALLFPVGRVKYLWPEPLARRSAVFKSNAPLKPGGPSLDKTSRQTTAIGYINRNNQKVVRRTDPRGTDHGQWVYVLQCGDCGYEYGANGSDVFQRKCPVHAAGRPGLPY